MNQPPWKFLQDYNSSRSLLYGQQVRFQRKNIQIKTEEKKTLSDIINKMDDTQIIWEYCTGFYTLSKLDSDHEKSMSYYDCSSFSVLKLNVTIFDVKTFKRPWQDRTVIRNSIMTKIFSLFRFSPIVEVSKLLSRSTVEVSASEGISVEWVYIYETIETWNIHDLNYSRKN